MINNPTFPESEYILDEINKLIAGFAHFRKRYFEKEPSLSGQLTR